MSHEPHTKMPAIPSGRRFSSVADMLEADGVSEPIRAKVKALANETRLVDRLAAIRHAAGITQEQLAAEMGVTQSAISKIENGEDGELTVAQIAAYSKLTSERLGLQFGKPYTHVEAIKSHAFAMRSHMLELAQIAQNYNEMEKNIAAFFGEAFFNILDILSECNSHLPNGGSGVEVRLTLTDRDLAAKPRVTTTSPRPADTRLVKA